MRRLNVKKLTWIVLLLFSVAACEKNKVKCTGNSQKDFTLSGFNKVIVNDNFNVIITRGTTYAVQARGCTESINDLNLSVDAGNHLNIRYKTNHRVHETIDMVITLPELVELEASAAARTTINGMAAQPSYLRIILSGAAESIVNGTPPEITYVLSGASKMEVVGTAAIFAGQISGASHLKAYGLASKRTDIEVSGASDAYITAQEKLSAEASGASTVYYRGNPASLYINTTGTSKIIKQ